jgi:hypothetical protein
MSKVVGDHLLCAADEIVFQHVYQGATYVVACRIADGTIVNYLTLTGANATVVILAAIADLTAARTSPEKVVAMGAYTDLGQIAIPSYTELEIIGKWTCQANLGTSFIVNSDQVGGNREIFIVGGHIDGNGANQNANMNTINFVNVADSVIRDCRLGGARRVDAEGETVKLEGCTRVIVEGNSFYTAIWGYDSIKVRLNSRYCVIANNVIDETNGGTSCGIQLATITDGYNVVIGNTIYGTGGAAVRSGIKMHSADKNLIIGNTIYNVPSYGVCLIANSSNNLIIGNFVSVSNVVAGLGIEATDSENAYDNVFRDNYVVLPNVTGAVGIDLWKNSRRTRLVGNTVIGGTAADTGINVRANASDTYIAENDLSDANLDTKITDAGTNTIIKRNRGYVTENTALSAEFPIDVAGIYTIDIAHGCSRIPDWSEISAVMVKGSTAWSAGFIGFIIGINTINAANVNVIYRVSTAGAAGQVARIALQIQSRGN